MLIEVRVPLPSESSVSADKGKRERGSQVEQRSNSTTLMFGIVPPSYIRNE